MKNEASVTKTGNPVDGDVNVNHDSTYSEAGGWPWLDMIEASSALEKHRGDSLDPVSANPNRNKDEDSDKADGGAEKTKRSRKARDPRGSGNKSGNPKFFGLEDWAATLVVPSIKTDDLADQVKRAEALRKVRDFGQELLKAEDQSSGIIKWSLGSALNQLMPINRPRNSRKECELAVGEWKMLLKSLDGMSSDTSELLRHIAVRFTREEAMSMGYSEMVNTYRRERRGAVDGEVNHDEKTSPSWREGRIGDIRAGVGKSHALLSQLTKTVSPYELSNADLGQLQPAYAEIVALEEHIKAIKREIGKGIDPEAKKALDKDDSESGVSPGRDKKLTNDNLPKKVASILRLATLLNQGIGNLPPSHFSPEEAIVMYEKYIADCLETGNLLEPVIDVLSATVADLKKKLGGGDA